MIKKKENKTEKLTVRWTLTELKQIKALADAYDVTPSEIVRQLVLQNVGQIEGQKEIKHEVATSENEYEEARGGNQVFEEIMNDLHLMNDALDVLIEVDHELSNEDEEFLLDMVDGLNKFADQLQAA